MLAEAPDVEAPVDHLKVDGCPSMKQLEDEAAYMDEMKHWKQREAVGAAVLEVSGYSCAQVV